jgi:hypothetical protein
LAYDRLKEAGVIKSQRTRQDNELNVLQTVTKSRGHKPQQVSVPPIIGCPVKDVSGAPGAPYSSEWNRKASKQQDQEGHEFEHPGNATQVRGDCGGNTADVGRCLVAIDDEKSKREGAKSVGREKVMAQVERRKHIGERAI